MVGLARARVIGVVVDGEPWGEGLCGFEGARVDCFEFKGGSGLDCWLDRGRFVSLYSKKEQRRDVQDVLREQRYRLL